MILVLTIGSLVLALVILGVMLMRKAPMKKKGSKDKADKIMEEIKNSMKIFEYPKIEEPEYKELKSNDKDVIDRTVDIFGDVIKKTDKKESPKKEEKLYASQTSKNYHEKGCLALKRVKKKISGTAQHFRDMKKKPCPICMPSEQ
jgi:hypothetical protein